MGCVCDLDEDVYADQLYCKNCRNPGFLSTLLTPEKENAIERGFYQRLQKSKDVDENITKVLTQLLCFDVSHIVVDYLNRFEVRRIRKLWIVEESLTLQSTHQVEDRDNKFFEKFRKVMDHFLQRESPRNPYITLSPSRFRLYFDGEGEVIPYRINLFRQARSFTTFSSNITKVWTIMNHSSDLQLCFSATRFVVMCQVCCKRRINLLVGHEYESANVIKTTFMRMHFIR